MCTKVFASLASPDSPEAIAGGRSALGDPAAAAVAYLASRRSALLAAFWTPYAKPASIRALTFFYFRLRYYFQR